MEVEIIGQITQAESDGLRIFYIVIAVNPLSIAPPLMERCYQSTRNGVLKAQYLGGLPSRSTTCAVIRGSGEADFCLGVVAWWSVY